MAGSNTSNQLTRKRVGRPPAVTEAVLGKLQEAFAFDCSIEEACFYADINPDTYYVYVKKHPKFSEKVKALKQRPVLLARQSVINGFADDPNLALKYLERKRKAEFSTKTETDVKMEVVQPILSGIAKNEPIEAELVYPDDNN